MLLLAFLSVNLRAQQYSAYTEYEWDQWQYNDWGYLYKSGWVYAVKVTYYGFTREFGDAKDFFFRFNYNDLNLHELSRKEWKKVKSNGGWIDTYCTFEYYITDQYPTLESALKAHSWPCAKYYLSANKPSVLKSTNAKVRVHMTDDDEVRTLNFWIDGVAFGITVHWDYSRYRMTYTY